MMKQDSSDVKDYIRCKKCNYFYANHKESGGAYVSTACDKYERDSDVKLSYKQMEMNANDWKKKFIESQETLKYIEKETKKIKKLVDILYKLKKKEVPFDGSGDSKPSIVTGTFISSNGDVMCQICWESFLNCPHKKKEVRA